MKRVLSIALVLTLLLTLSGAVWAREKPKPAGGNLPAAREARLALKAARMLERSEADLKDEEDEALQGVKSKIQKAKPVENRRLSKLALYPYEGSLSDQDLVQEDPFRGHVMVVTARGIHDLAILGVIGGLDDEETYNVWVRDLKDGYNGASLASAAGGYHMLTTFKTDEEGHGNFHYKILDSDLEAGTYNLQVVIKKGDASVAATLHKEVTVD
jgi:hypothetical protein